MPKSSQGKKQKHKTSKKPKVDYCTFIVEVMDWELPYLFSINHNDRYDPTPYSEYLHMHVKGVLREPKKMDGKEIDLTFIGERSIIAEISNRSSKNMPLRVGTVTMRGEYRDFIGSLPYDSLPMIASMLETKRLRYIHLHGPSLYRGNAATTSINFFKDYDPEDY